MASLFETELTALKGVGPRRAAQLAKLGAPTVGALLRCYPRSYEDWSSPQPIAQAAPGSPCLVKATVLRRPAAQRVRGGLTLYKTAADDGSAVMDLVFFNNPYLPNQLQEGREYLFRGKMGGTLLRRQMSAPEFLPAGENLPVRPVYRLTEGLSNRMVTAAVARALEMLPQQVRDPLPPDLRERCGLCGLREALVQIHRPDSREALERAKRRLVFEELLVLQLGLFLLRSRERAPAGTALPRDCTEEFFRLLPFAPTRAQRRAVREAVSDLRGGKPMNRLVQGDVGSGKTVVAAALCYMAAKNGAQAALMAPTEILAEQHYRSLSALLAPAGIPVALLTGSQGAASRRQTLEGLASGEIRLVVGTHALLGEGVRFARLGLVVTDEQHRFGVAQRAALASKGERPHLLVMSATPIPRTLALMIYGDLDLSVLDELPPGRQPVSTYVIGSGKRRRALGFLQKQIDAGRQCYVVCPMVEEGAPELASVGSYAARLQQELPRARVGVLHGKMKPREKEAAMAAFAAGERDILVSTTVVEVGVDVPNATVMLVENAERYGLSQLHQLRGRVGRGAARSYCILVSDAQNEEAVARLQIMRRTNDGFRIADEDLRLRGPGDFFGSRQHGLPSLKIADLSGDMALLHLAQEEARALLREDPALDSHRLLRAEVRAQFSAAGSA